MDKSESIIKLAEAFAKAQAKITGAVKDKANPFFKSSYATLESVVDTIRPVAALHGLSFIQVSHDIANSSAIETIILHESGEWLSTGIVSVPVSKNDAQGFGSALTYARRYSLSAAFGVAPEDDDGNAATKAKPDTKTPPFDLDAASKAIENTTTKAKAKEVMLSYLPTLAAANDTETAAKLKAVLIAHGVFIDQAEKVES